MTLNVALFRQDFKNFQLNTFDGTVFIVQNINGCEDDLGSADEDQSKFSTAATSTGAAATGACASGDVGYGVRSQGVEIEASARVDAGPARQRRPHLRRHPLSRRSGRHATTARRSTRHCRQLPGSRSVERAELGPDRLGRLDPADRRVRACPACSTSTAVTAASSTPAPTCSPRRARTASRSSTRASASAGPTTAGRSELWAQNLFDKDYQQVAFNSPFQGRARSARRSPIPHSRADGRSSRLPRRAADLRPDASRRFAAPRAAPSSGTAASATAAATARDADLPGRIRDPGDGSLPSSAAASAAAAAAARTRLIAGQTED